MAERVDRTAIEPGQVVVQDRVYARVRDFAAVLAAKADFITRTGWNALRLIGEDGQQVDPLQCLPSTSEPQTRLKHLVRRLGVLGFDSAAIRNRLVMVSSAFTGILSGVGLRTDRASGT